MMSEEFSDSIHYQMRINSYRTRNRDLPSSHLELLVKFDDRCMMKNLTFASRSNYLTNLFDFLLYFKNRDIQKLELKDIEKYNINLFDRKLAPRTIRSRIIVVKVFLKFIDKKYISKKLELPIIRQRPYSILTQEEVDKMIRYTKNMMDRALISILYESGMRSAELRSIKIEDISFDNIGAKIVIDGKTGFRPVRLVNSVKYLTGWLFHHKFSKDSRSYLFYPVQKLRKDATYADKNISESALCDKLRRAAKRVGLENKKVNPHNFRHSRYTKLGHYLSDRELKAHGGWRTTKMIDVYTHIVSKDLDEALLRKVYKIESEV